MIFVDKESLNTATKRERGIVFIDYLKALGLLLIILAHTCDNQIILNLRVFDVPLMVVVSGFLAYDSYKRSIAKGGTVWDYYKKRVTRLLIPTWIFLTFYFIVYSVIGAFTGDSYSLETILRSYFLMDGIGYVWIIRVYLICALLTPLSVFVIQKVRHKPILFFSCALLLLIQEVLVFNGINEHNAFFEYVVAYAIPYGVMYFLGMFGKCTKNKKYDFIIAGCFLAAFVLCVVISYLQNGAISSIQAAKYPPLMYYTSYSLFICFCLFGVMKRIKLKRHIIIDFLSRSSLWIYLWHIIFIRIVVLLGLDFWVLNYIIVVIGASILTFIQNVFLDYLENERNIKSKVLLFFRG